MDIVFGGLIILVGYGAVLAYFPLQIYTAFRLRGAMRIIGLLPIVLMVPVLKATANAYAEKSNLWPILMIFASPFAAGFLIVLLVVDRFVQKKRV